VHPQDSRKYTESSAAKPDIYGGINRHDWKSRPSRFGELSCRAWYRSARDPRSTSPRCAWRLLRAGSRPAGKSAGLWGSRSLTLRLLGARGEPGYAAGCRALLDWTAEGGCPYVDIRSLRSVGRTNACVPTHSSSALALSSIRVRPSEDCIMYQASR
jgi:hypothetical protein